MRNTELPPYDAFCSKLRSCDPPEAEQNDHSDLLKCGMTTEQATVKLRLPKHPPTAVDNHQYLQQTWKQQSVRSFRHFFCAGITVRMLFPP